MRRGITPTGRWVLVVFAVGAVVLIGAAAVGLASSQRDQRSQLRDRFRSRAEIGAALIDSIFSASVSGQQEQLARQYGGPVVDKKDLQAQATRGNSRFVAIADEQGNVIAATPGAPAGLEDELRSRPGYLRRALAGSVFGLSGVRDGTVTSAIAFKAADGSRRVQVSGVPASLLGAFLGGTLKQVSTNTGSASVVLDENGQIIARNGKLTEQRRRFLVGTTMTNGEVGDALYTSRPIGATGWRLALLAPAGLVYEPANGTAKWLPWVILCFVAVALALLALLLRRTITSAAEIREANADLARSNADLERFAYVASHDLSEPLRTIGGFSSLLERRHSANLDQSAREMLGHITAGATRLQAMIDGLLSYARVSTAPRKVESVDLGPLAHEVADGIAPALAERDSDLEIEELPVVSGERNLLAQLLQNLILNAAKFTSDHVRPQIRITSAPALDGFWRISVIDNGVGVPPERVEQIFEMFERGPEPSSRSGTGIGLALCARIVERHGGTIGVQPGPDGGSIFSFTLPGAPRTGAPQQPSEERVLTG